MTVDQGRTALYRLYSKRGRLLYVGITSNPEKRFAQHKADKAWWPRVATRDVEWYDTRTAAAAAEVAAIRSGEPPFNREHSAGVDVSFRVSSRVHVEGLDLLARLFGVPRERVFAALLIRELGARGLLGTSPCFHSASGWPEGLIVDPARYANGERCSCDALVSDPPDVWYQRRLQLEAKEAVRSSPAA